MPISTAFAPAPAASSRNLKPLKIIRSEETIRDVADIHLFIAMSNPAASLCGPLVGGQADRRHRLRDLTRGKFGQGREDELRLSDLLAGVSYA